MCLRPMRLDVVASCNGGVPESKVLKNDSERPERLKNMYSRYLFLVSAAIEMIFGLALLLAPAPTLYLLIGDALSDEGLWTTRVLGVALLSLGISAWETVRQQTKTVACIGLFLYNAVTAGLMILFAFLGDQVGILLWPAITFHVFIAVAMLMAIQFRFRILLADEDHY